MIISWFVMLRIIFVYKSLLEVSQDQARDAQRIASKLLAVRSGNLVDVDNIGEEDLRSYIKRWARSL